VRYELGEDFQLVIYSENYFKKFEVLEKNNKVAIALHNPGTPYRGIQVWGTAELITMEDPRHFDYLPAQAKNSEKMKEICKVLTLILVTPHRVMMFDQQRKGDSYIAWQKDASGKEKEMSVKSGQDLAKI